MEREPANIASQKRHVTLFYTLRVECYRTKIIVVCILAATKLDSGVVFVVHLLTGDGGLSMC